MARLNRWVCCLSLLVCVVGVAVSASAYELLAPDFPFAIPAQARQQTTRWLRLALDIEDYYPVTTNDGVSKTVHAQAVLPELLLQVPDRPLRPYIGMGLGVSLNRVFTGMVLAPDLIRLQESLVTHVGGGVTYHLSEGVSLLGGVRYAQFRSTDVLTRLGLSSRDLTDDFSVYAIEFSLRMSLSKQKP